MNTFAPEVDAAFDAGAVPHPAELAEARSVILETLSGDAITRASADFTQEACRRAGIPADGLIPAVVLERDVGRSEFVPPSGDEPALRRIRIGRAVRESLVSLWRDGIITPVVGNHHGEGNHRIDVHWQNNYGSTEVRDITAVFVPQDDGRWRLTQSGDAHPAEVLSLDEFTSGLDDLLGPRGLRTLREAHTAYRHRLYLAVGNLLGGASEAAWIRVGQTIVDMPGMAKALERTERGEIGGLIDTAAPNLRSRLRGPARGRVGEVATVGHHLRDVRNYGVHPGEPHDDDREVPFTQAGAATLMLSARRYFSTLATIRAALLDASPDDAARPSTAPRGCHRPTHRLT